MKLLSLAVIFFSFQLHAQKIADKSFDSFYKEKIGSSKGLLIVNYWATWCQPCVAELPYFERISSELKSEGVKVLLVNLDFNSKFRTDAENFVSRKNINSEVIHINDTDPNTWINRADSSWSGAIPATFFYNDGKKIFFREGGMTYEELKSEIMKTHKSINNQN